MIKTSQHNIKAHAMNVAEAHLHFAYHQYQSIQISGNTNLSTHCIQIVNLHWQNQKKGERKEYARIDFFEIKRNCRTRNPDYLKISSSVENQFNIWLIQFVIISR